MIGEFALGSALGQDRCGKINSVNSVSESWTGIGVVVGFLTGVGMRKSLYLKMTACVSIRRYLQTLQSLKLIGKTCNHLNASRFHYRGLYTHAQRYA